MRSRNHYHNAQGTTFIVVGGAGCDEMPYKVESDSDEVVIDPFAPRSNPYPQDSLPFGARLGDVFTDVMASGLLTVVNHTALHWQLFNSHSAEVIDDLWLTRDA